MTLRAFKERGSKNFDVAKIQDSIREYTSNLINGVEILNGNLIQDIEIVTGTPKIVNHGLGRTLVGYFIAKISADANVWDTASDSRTLTLNSSANVTITIWAF